MGQSAQIPSCRILVLFPLLAGIAWPAGAATDPRVNLSESYGKLPLQFEANRGQTDKQVHFLSRGVGYSLYLTSGEAVLVLSKPAADAKRVALRMSLVGAARQPLVSGVEEQPGKANYLIGKDRSKWQTNVPTYAKVRYKNVYRGTDLLYYGNQRQLEYDFVLAPGADPNKIVLGFKGVERLEITAQGELVLHAAGGDVRQHKPVIYQNIDGVRREIDGGYVLKGAKRVGFQVAAYDRSRPLVIDPVLAYSTYLGGHGIAVDTDGNAYVVGSTGSTAFPTTAGAFQPNYAGGYGDAFVTKLNSTGSALVYSTYLGGSGWDRGHAIAVDTDGNAYVTGMTSSIDFPTTPGALLTTTTGGGYADTTFVTKLNPTGSALIYSTYIFNSLSSGDAIAVDTAGNAYVTGLTWCNCGTGYETAFVFKLDPTGSAAVYSNRLGTHSPYDGIHSYGSGIAVDAAGNAYVTGSTNASPRNFPITAGAFQSTPGGSSDAFIMKLDPAGGVVYSTFLGGSDDDRGRGIAVDARGNCYVTGSTKSSNFPTTPGASQTIYGGGGSFYGGGDAFVAKLDPTGSALVYSTYLGGSGDELGYGIALDTDGNVYVTGSTNSTDFPTTAGAFQATYGGGYFDAFVTKLDSTGSRLVYSNYLGGSGDDQGIWIAVDIRGNAYVAGGTDSTDFPTTPGAFQVSPAGAGGFVAKIVDVTRSEESAATAIGFWTTYGAETGSFSGGSIVASNFPASTTLFRFTGTAVSWIGVKCNVCGIAVVSIDGGAPTLVDTAGPGAPGGLSSEPVFSASGLAAKSHTMAIIVTGRSTSGGRYVAVDAFDVTAGSATAPPLPPVVLPPPPLVTLPPFLGL